MKIVIIGGVAGGATAAARLRRVNEKAEIIMVERNGYISFANCGLPYHIGGVIKERERLLVSTPQLFRDRFRIDVRTRTEALRIDRENKRVVLKDLSTNREYTESYDRLLLSPGGVPIRPTPVSPMKGSLPFGIWRIWTVSKIGWPLGRSPGRWS